MESQGSREPESPGSMQELSVSFGYRFNMREPDSDHTHRFNDSPSYSSSSSSLSSSYSPSLPPPPASRQENAKRPSFSRARGWSFSCLSGAALGANFTLANTRLGKGLIGEEILPGLDSPKSFRPLERSPSFSVIESLICSSAAAASSSVPALQPHCRDPNVAASRVTQPRLEPSSSSSFLTATDFQTAGGAAGEDRIQAVCSQQDEWLFCAIYDGFNGRDAADFLAGTLYEKITILLGCHPPPPSNHHYDHQGHHPHQLGHDLRQQEDDHHKEGESQQEDEHHKEGDSQNIEMRRGDPSSSKSEEAGNPSSEHAKLQHCNDNQDMAFQQKVLDSLQRALEEAEASFLRMVEQETDDRPELAMVGSCVLVVLLYRGYVYTLNLGDSRAILATKAGSQEGSNANTLTFFQLTQDHVVAKSSERERVIAEHPDDSSAIRGGRVKGRIKLTRAFGAGYLKKAELNDKLMGMLRVPNLVSPPYISSKAHVGVRKLSGQDLFVVMGSDGLFDFFSDGEVVELVHGFISAHPDSNPAKFMLDQLLIRAAHNAGITLEDLKTIPIGRRRTYHDDVTIMVVTLGIEQKTSSASIGS